MNGTSFAADRTPGAEAHRLRPLQHSLRSPFPNRNDIGGTRVGIKLCYVPLAAAIGMDADLTTPWRCRSGARANCCNACTTRPSNGAAYFLSAPKIPAAFVPPEMRISPAHPQRYQPKM